MITKLQWTLESAEELDNVSIPNPHIPVNFYSEGWNGALEYTF